MSGVERTALPSSDEDDSGTDIDERPPPAPVPLWPPPLPQVGTQTGVPVVVQRVQPKDSFGRPLAAWVKRVLAFLTDFFLLFFLLDAFGSVVFPKIFASTIQAVPTSQVYEFWGVNAIVWTGYLGLCACSRRGQTVGMMFFGIAVRDDRTGGQVRVGRAVIRSAILIVFFGFLFDCLWPLWDPKRQALHDKAARTVVVNIRIPLAERVPPTGF